MRRGARAVRFPPEGKIHSGFVGLQTSYAGKFHREKGEGNAFHHPNVFGVKRLYLVPEMTGYQGNSALGQSGHAGGIPRQPWGVISLLGETTYEGLGFRPMELGAATQGAPAEGP